MSIYFLYKYQLLVLYSIVALLDPLVTQLGPTYLGMVVLPVLVEPVVYKYQVPQSGACVRLQRVSLNPRLRSKLHSNNELLRCSQTKAFWSNQSKIYLMTLLIHCGTELSRSGTWHWTSWQLPDSVQSWPETVNCKHGTMTTHAIEHHLFKKWRRKCKQQSTSLGKIQTPGVTTTEPMLDHIWETPWFWCWITFKLENKKHGEGQQNQTQFAHEKRRHEKSNWCCLRLKDERMKQCKEKVCRWCGLTLGSKQAREKSRKSCNANKHQTTSCECVRKHWPHSACSTAHLHFGPQPASPIWDSWSGLGRTVLAVPS